MKVTSILDSVKITPTHVKIRRGLTSINMPREAVVAVRINYLTGTVVFHTMSKKFKVVLWHGYRRIKRELGFL